MRLKDKVAIITGGGRGIGEFTAKRFSQEGAKVVVADVNEDDVNRVVAELTDSGGQAIGIKVDVTNRAIVDEMFKTTITAYGKLDILINNAGITADNTLLKMTEAEWDRVLNVNLKGVFHCGQAAATVMVAKGNGGVILNASSIVGIYGNYGQTNYAATKWGVIGMTKSWAKELGRSGIRVNAVAPGFIVTPMTEKMPEKVLEMMKEKSALKSLGYADDIANAYLYLASDEARFITGTVLCVDGGLVL